MLSRSEVTGGSRGVILPLSIIQINPSPPTFSKNRQGVMRELLREEARGTRQLPKREGKSNPTTSPRESDSPL